MSAGPGLTPSGSLTAGRPAAGSLTAGRPPDCLPADLAGRSLRPAAQPTIPAMNITLSALTGSAPVAMAQPTVSAAPIPTHTAYAVPRGMRFTARPRPYMLSAAAARKTSDGPCRVSPSDIPRAVAHTASRTADASSMTQAV